jgi:hypothetical protein
VGSASYAAALTSPLTGSLQRAATAYYLVPLRLKRASARVVLFFTRCYLPDAADRRLRSCAAAAERRTGPSSADNSKDFGRHPGFHNHCLKPQLGPKPEASSEPLEIPSTLRLPWGLGIPQTFTVVSGTCLQ